MKNYIVNLHLRKVLLSKINVAREIKLPFISLLRSFYMLSLKVYLKSGIIFLIVVSIVFAQFLILKKIALKSFILLEILLFKKYFCWILIDFCKIYLPQYSGYIYKKYIHYSVYYPARHKLCVNLYYFGFPTIIELHRLVEQLGSILNVFFSKIKIQFEFSFKNTRNLVSVKNGLLLNYFRVPCVRYIKNYAV